MIGGLSAVSPATSVDVPSSITGGVRSGSESGEPESAVPEPLVVPLVPVVEPVSVVTRPVEGFSRKARVISLLWIL